MKFTLSSFQQISQSLNQFSSDIDQKYQQLLYRWVEHIIFADTNTNSSYDQEEIIDYFYQSNGINILTKSLKRNSLSTIKILALLLINVKQQTLLTYLLCKPIITEIIMFNQKHQQCQQEQEWIEQYIALLKSIAIRTNAAQLSLFYNEKLCSMPIILQAIKYHNHADCMVRTNIMSIVMSFIQVEDPLLHHYFSHFPFIGYILGYCYQIYMDIKRTMDDDRKIDIKDELNHLQDLLNCGNEQLKFVILSCIINYLVHPLMKFQCYIKVIEVYKLLLQIIKSSQIHELICMMIFNYKLPKTISILINRDIYVPQLCKQKNEKQDSFWKKFRIQINKYCKNMYYQATNQKKKQKQEINNNEFLQQIHNISKYLRFDIFSNEQMCINRKVSILELQYCKQQQFLKNVFIDEILIKLNTKKQMTNLNFQTILIQFLLTIVDSKYISKKVLQHCGLFALSENEKKDPTIKFILNLIHKRFQIIQTQISPQFLKQYIYLRKMIGTNSIHYNDIKQLYYNYIKQIQKILEQKSNVNILVNIFETQIKKQFQKQSVLIVKSKIKKKCFQKNQNLSICSLIKGFKLIRQLYHYLCKKNRKQNHNFTNFNQIYDNQFSISQQMKSDFGNKCQQLITCFIKSKEQLKYPGIIHQHNHNLKILVHKNKKFIQKINCPWKYITFNLNYIQTSIIQVQINQPEIKTQTIDIILQNYEITFALSKKLKYLQEIRYLREKNLINEFLMKCFQE